MSKKISIMTLVFLMQGCCAGQELRLEVGSYTDQNKRLTQEDRYHYEAIGSKRHFFGMYDGHGGDSVAEWLSKFLHIHFKETQGTPEARLKETFFKAEEEIQSLGKVDVQGGQYYRSGSTAVVTFIDENGNIHFANVGDSRAVLGGNGTVVCATKDHKTSNEDEQERIKKVGNYIEFGRVFGRIAITRAFGDACLKACRKDVLIAEPEYTTYAIKQDCPEHRILVIASDGLWDAMSSEDAIKFVEEKINEGYSVDDTTKMLVEKAKIPGKDDNITAFVVDLQAKTWWASLSRVKKAVIGGLSLTGLTAIIALLFYISQQK